MVLFARKAAELGLPILFHAGPSPIGRCECSNIKYIEDLAIMVPEVTIILGHGGGYLAPWLAQKHENVYIDTSFSNPDLAALDIDKTFLSIGHTLIDKNIVKMTGASKICFASDTCPETTHLYKDAMNYVNGLDVSDDEKAMIFGGNAKRILEL
jgi:predicted TIM-barrel fold metal-dependent hydrolase